MPSFLVGHERKRLKIRLCESQNWRCCYCGIQVSIEKEDVNKPHSATFEHVVPMAYHIREATSIRMKRWLRKGANRHKRYWNYNVLVIACRSCNGLRKSIDAEAFFNGQMWKPENRLIRKLHQMGAYFKSRGGIAVLKAMGDYCYCEREYHG